MDGSNLWSYSFISHYGIILTVWNSTLEYRAAMMASYLHWSSELQARLPPSCHLCRAAPLQGSRKGLSNPGSDARHFPDTLRSRRYIHMLNQIHHHLCLIELSSPLAQAWFPPSPWHLTLSTFISHSNWVLEIVRKILPALLDLFRLQRRDNCRHS